MTRPIALSIFAALTLPSVAFGAPSLAVGASVKVLDVDAADIYYKDKATLVGQTCTVGSAPAVADADSWYTGEFLCNGAKYYFYRVKVEAGALPSTVPAGTLVRVNGLSKADAYFSTKDSYLGLQCTVSEGLTLSEGIYYSGAMHCGDKDPYFYQVSFDVLGMDPNFIANRPHGDTVYASSRVLITDVSSADAYYADRKGIIGKSCTASDNLPWSDGKFYSGGVSCDDGSTYYFYQFSFDVLYAAPETTAAALGPIANGTAVTILDISPEDAYYPDMASIVGKSCTATADLSWSDANYYSGPVSCTDGSSYYFYQAAFEVGASSGIISSGTAFTIADVSPEDAYYADRASIIGKSCYADGDLYVSEGSWYTGQVQCTDNTSYYFYQVATSVSGGAASASVAGTGALTIAQGTDFKITGLSPEDAYYSDMSTIVGKSCHAAAEMTLSDGRWYSGSVACTDGSTYYFYQVATSKTDAGATSSGGGDRFMGLSVKKGKTVQIIDISSGDPWAAKADLMKGQFCKVKKALASSGDGWFKGELKCGAAKLSFEQVAVSVIP